MERGAEDVQELARKMSPVDMGNLEKAIKIASDTEGINRRKRFEIYIDEDMPAEGRKVGIKVGKYSVYMHESIYNLGKKSKAKESAVGVKVGRKFLERAGEELTPEIVEKVKAAVAKVV